MVRPRRHDQDHVIGTDIVEAGAAPGKVVNVTARARLLHRRKNPGISARSMIDVMYGTYCWRRRRKIA